jgi:membrane protease YdiL (CAAX protease family)
MLGRSAVHSRLQVWISLLVFVLAFLSSWIVGEALLKTGQSKLIDPIVTTGLYLLLFVPLILCIDPSLRSRDHWRLPARSWIGVGGIVVLQVFLGTVTKVANPTDRSISALVAALVCWPVFEEVLRAMILRSLADTTGVVSAIVASSVLYAIVHAVFWIALPQCIGLALIFIFSGESIPAAILAHIAMNLAATHESIEHLIRAAVR